MTYIFIVLVVLALLAMLPAWLEARRKPIDRKYRQNAPGSFAALSQGVTHYQWHGPTRGPVLVAIHGLTTPSKVWDHIAPAFGALGYRVLTYDLYGRGYSSAPRGAQTAEFFERQLNELLDNLEIEGNLCLLGYSMGGSIATTFAARNQHRVDQVFLVAPAGIAVNETKFDQFCRKYGILGNWVHDVFAAPRLARDIRGEKTESQISDLRDVQLAQLDRKGFLSSVLSSRRGLLTKNLETEHREFAKRNTPVFVVWGAKDKVIPVEALAQLALWNRGAYQEVLETADHSLPYTQPDEVMAAFRSLMKSRF